MAPLPQRVCPAGQVTLHVPPTQLWPVAQDVPQVPQLLKSVVMLTQVPLQRELGLVQTGIQIPLEQVSLDWQALPQAPQLLLEERSLHPESGQQDNVPVQTAPPPLRPEVALQVHLPALQVSWEPQDAVHEPQCFGSELRLEQK